MVICDNMIWKMTNLHKLIFFKCNFYLQDVVQTIQIGKKVSRQLFYRVSW